MKKTPLTDAHIAMGAKMQEYAGFNIPREYSGDVDEQQAVNNRVGVSDLSHIGQIWVKGPRALAFLERVTTNDVDLLEIGKVQHTNLINENGDVVDNIMLYHYAPEKYMMVVCATNIDKDWKWCVDNNDEYVELENASDKIGLIAVQGPKSLDTLQKLTKIDLSTISDLSFVIGQLKGSAFENVIISNTRSTGVIGFYIFCFAEYTKAIWAEILKAGAEFDIKPIGLATRQALHL